MVVLLVEAGVLWAPLCVWCVCSVSAWTFGRVEQSALGCGQMRMDKHADGCLSQRAKIRARLGVGGYVMDGRDTVIGLPQKGVDCRRPGQGWGDQEGSWGSCTSA